MSANPTPLQPRPFAVTVESTATSSVVRCSGTLTLDHVDALKTAVRAVITENGSVQVDLAGVDYVDSAGLGALVSLYTSARTAHCQFKLINFNERIADVLHITNLLWVLT